MLTNLTNHNDPNVHTATKLNKNRAGLDVAEFSFSKRVVNEWNILESEIISGCSVAGFKLKPDRHLKRQEGIHISFSFLPLT